MMKSGFFFNFKGEKVFGKLKDKVEKMNVADMLATFSMVPELMQTVKKAGCKNVSMFVCLKDYTTFLRIKANVWNMIEELEVLG